MNNQVGLNDNLYNNEQEYYTQQDRSPSTGYLELGRVVSYDSGTSNGVASVNGSQIQFKNLSAATPAANDQVVVSLVNGQSFWACFGVYEV